MVETSSRRESFDVLGMDCPQCARSIEKGVGRLSGVSSCAVDFSTGRLRVDGEFDSAEVRSRVRELGFKANSADGPGEDMRQGFFAFLTARRETRWTALGALLILPGLIWHEILAHESWWVDGLSLSALIVAGFPVIKRAVRNFAINREIDINVLMSIAAVGAVVIGAYTEAGMVMVLFAMGEALEGYTSTRARRSIKQLVDLAPERAEKIMGSNDTGFMVPLDSLKPGDRILVRPGGRIPIDGRIQAGQTSVNQAPITGESAFVEKSEGDVVYAGSVNGPGSVEVLVSHLASDSTLSRMIRMIEDSQEKRAPSQRFIDRFARVYTPLVVAMAALVVAVPPLVWGLPFWNPSQGETGWLYRGLALLVVACPCALVISVPVSIVSAISHAARHGILFKGGAALEALSQVRAIAFDKTGTLTEGSPSVIQVRSERCLETPGESCDECDELVALVSAVERRSEHPLARALVQESVLRGVEERYPPADSVEAQIGQGVTGQVAGKLIQIGSHRFFDSAVPHDVHCQEAGRAAGRGLTPVLVSAEGRYLGFLSLADKIRHGSRETLQALKDLGLSTLVMLTGDSGPTARLVAEQVGVSDVRADLLPQHKVEQLHDLERHHGGVAMVGDGLNDAPALSAATVGIALGGIDLRSDQALETADVTLMSGNLRGLPYAFSLSRAAMRTVKINVLLALSVKLAFLVLVILGMGTLWMAVVSDVGTSLLVTLNGMRLLRGPGGKIASAYQASD